MIKLTKTLNLLIDCWSTVEDKVRALIAERYWAHDEVFITRLFCGELKWALQRESEQNRFSQAFLSDLRAAFEFYKWLDEDLEHLSTGFVARVHYHEPATEKFTGGDLGLTVMRPNVEYSKVDSTLRHELCEQGLLCQAKRQTKARTWGSLTDRQRIVLPGHLGFLALLFYGYKDNARISLEPFTWKICSASTIDDVESWLAAKALTGCLTSAQILQSLGEGEIGTGDRELISHFICPPTEAFLKVELTWRNDNPFPEPPDFGGGGAQKSSGSCGQHGIRF